MGYIESMPGPRYAPREYTDDPAAFGKAESLSWPQVTTTVERSRRRAAVLQHLYVRRIRQRLKAKRMKVADFAERSGSSYYRMSRLLRGEIVMRLEDIAIADLLLDEVSEFAIEFASKKRDGEARAQAESQPEPRPPAPAQPAVSAPARNRAGGLSQNARKMAAVEKARAAGII